MEERLALLNPWWEPARGWGQRLDRRDLHSSVLAALLDPGAEPGVLLVGFRRVGKTVLAKQILRHLAEDEKIPVTNLLYVDFQEDSFSDVEPIDILEFLRRRREPGHPCCVVFDEIQFLPDWDKKLRAVLHETRKPEIYVLATGSSALTLRGASGDVLLDRARQMRLSPMLLGEWLRFVGQKGVVAGPPLHDTFERFTVRGGFPGLVFEDSPHEARRRLRALCEQRVIDGDLVHRLRIRRRNTFGRVWRHLVHHPGRTLDWRDLHQEFGVSRETLEDWVEALARAEMIRQIRPSTPAGAPEEGKGRYSRVYPVDHALSGAYGVPVLEGGGMEAMVLSHLEALREALDAAGRRPHLTFWRDDRVRGPNEIDFRVEARDVSLLVEAKGATRVAGDRITRLARVAARLKASRCLLVHAGTERRTERRTADGRDVEIHLWPVPEFLLTLYRCGINVEELFR